MSGENVLEKIVAYKRQTVEHAKQQLPLNLLANKVVAGNFAFSQALQTKSWGLIAECKKASPVKGNLSGCTVKELAQLYEANGATALSILTDSHFNGSIHDIAAARAVSSLPILRKDFVIDQYQIFEARLANAAAILLIAAILNDQQLREYLAIAEELGLDCLVEVHTRKELQRVQQTPARIIGINNRNLTNFTTSIEQTFALLPYCDADRLIVSESGITSEAQAKQLKQAGVRAILVGEGLVTAGNIAQMVQELSQIETEAR